MQGTHLLHVGALILLLIIEIEQRNSERADLEEADIRRAHAVDETADLPPTELRAQEDPQVVRVEPGPQADEDDEFLAVEDTFSTPNTGTGPSAKSDVADDPLARALADRPKLLLLDEVSSALDVENEQAVMQEIDRFRGQMTIIVIAHRLSTIRNADTIHLLENGRVAESGAWDELIQRKGKFNRLYQMQSGEVK